MPLSRLENFIKNVEGNILYVNPNDQDATDSITNQGNSLTRPFKTIQRALIEAARFSYVVGKDNDKFDKTTILVYPGIHKIDNRPGYSIHNNSGTAEYKNRFGSVVASSELTSSSNFDIEDPANVLYQFNSVNGGVIIPRGTSLVGMDLRKTKIYPMFVPDPQNNEIDSTAIFRVTGGCYFWQFTLFDGEPNSNVYKNYTTSRFSPNFSHHKLTCFEYADGNTSISLDAVTGGTAVTSQITDLDNFYNKIANAYGPSSGREIPSWPANEFIQPKLAENEIVGAIQADPIGITSVFSTNSPTYVETGAVGSNVVVTTSTPHNLNVGTPILVSGITTSSAALTQDPLFNADGGAVVAEVLSDNQFAFTASAATSVAYPHLSGDENVQVEPDTVTGASPYIFNCSLRSVYGMNGLHADGSKATGFKSMVLAQFTGIGLQKDDNSFLIYNTTTGSYNDTTTAAESEKPLHINSSAVFKPQYENTHVKVSNSAILQCVSIFAIGFANHFVAETGGDQSITNSNSNFGAKSLIARKFRKNAFQRDNSGYITHIIPPKQDTKIDESFFWVPLDVGLTTNYTVGSGTSDRLYTFGYSDIDAPPTHIIDSFRIGAREGEVIKLEVNNNTQSANVLMEGSDTATFEKTVNVSRNATGTANSITESSGSIFYLDNNHELSEGESIRILSDDGTLPDGIDESTVYYTITDGLPDNQIKIAKTLNESLTGNINPVEEVNTIGGKLKIISRVSDKLPGDPGHPLQFDTTVGDTGNWYLRVEAAGSNTIYDSIKDIDRVVTSKTFISRKSDSRNLIDRLYKVRYVIPREYQDAKPPTPGYVIQESSTSIVASNSEYTSDISNTTDFRNVKILHNLNFDATTGITTVTSEVPHKLKSGSIVKINKVKSSNNVTADANIGFNGSYEVDNIIDSKTFEIVVPLANNPGTFLPERPASISNRNENTPNFSINEYAETYYVYRVETIKEYEEGTQDGIYHLICLLGSINPSSSYFNDIGFSQNVVNLYPQIDRDNYTIDPKPSISVAKNYPVSKVITDDLRNSITKEFVNSFLVDNRVGFKIVGATYDQTTGIATFASDIEHNFDNVINVSVADSGSGYGYSGLTTTIYNAKLVGGTGEGATVTFISQSGGDHNLESPIIIDGGSGYTVGDTLAISAVGINTFSAGGVIYTPASLSVTGVNRAKNNSLQIENVIDYGVGDAFNGVYKIIDVPSSTEVSVQLPPGLSGVGTYKKFGTFAVAGSASTITNLQYTDSTTGIVTVTTDSPHGLSLGNSFKLDWNEESNSVTSVYNGTFTVNERIGINTFTFFIGDSVSVESVPSTVGKVLPTGYSAQEFDTGAIENVEKRMNSFYAGITTATNASISQSSTSITLISSVGFGKGDYLQVGPEIVRVKTNFSSNQAQIIRGVFGTRVSTIPSGTLAKKITPIPVEGRRYSILRASGHTFEYVGFGPGNYSTALPQRQDRVLTQDEQLLSQAERSDGGVVVYTGMNDTGDFYVGNKRFSATTGEEETINIPIITYVGDDGDGSRLSLVVDDITVKEFIKVEGGAGGVIQSEFNGPVLFTEKINVTSDKGADFKFITLKGTETNTTRRRYTVGLGTPVETGDYSVGDIVFKNDPEPGGYLGWVYAGEEGTEDNSWRKFGLIATERANDGNFPDSNNESPLGNFTILPSRIGINTNIPADIIDVQAGTTKLDRLYVAGIATFNSPVQLGQVTLDNLIVNQSINVSGKFQANTPLGFGVTGNVTICGMTTIHDSLTVSGDTAISGALTVSGHTTLGRKLTVSSSTCLKGALTVSGHTDLNRSLQVSGNTSIGQKLTVTGPISGGNTLSLSGNAAVGGGLTVTGNTSIAGNLDVAGSSSLHGGLTVSGGTSLHGGLAVRGFAEFHDDIFISGNTLHTGRLMVSGDAYVNVNSGVTTVGGDLYVCGKFDVGSDITISGDTTICGDTYIGGTTSIGGGLDVSGNASIGGGLHVSGDTTISGALTVSGHTDLNRSLQVSGTTSIGKNLIVSGNTDLRGKLQVSGNTSIKGGLNVCGGMNINGLANFNDDIFVSGNTLHTGRLMVSGDAYLNVNSGITTIGGALTVSGNSDLNGTLQVSGNVCIGGVTQITGNTSVGGALTVSGHTDLNRSLQVSGNVCIGGVTQIKGNTSVGGSLNVRGALATQGGLTACGAAIFHDNVLISGGTQLTGDLAAANISTGGYLHVSANGFIGGSATVSKSLIIKSSLQFIEPGNKYVQFRLVSSDNTTFAGHIRSANHQNASIHNHIIWNRGGSVNLYHNNTVKLSTKSTGTEVFGTICTTGAVIKGNTSVSGTLTVSGHTDLNRTLQVSGNVCIGGVTQIKGNTSVGGTLQVGGLTTLVNARATGALQVQGTTCMAGNLQVKGSTCLVGVLQSKGNTSIGGVLNVKGVTALASTLQVTGDINSLASVTASSGVLIEGQGNPRIEIRSQNGGTPYIDWSNDSTTDYDARLLLVDNNTLKLEGADLLVSGGLTVRNNLTISGTTAICGALTVSGNTTIKSNLTVCGDLTLSGDLIGPTNWIVPGYATVSKYLNVRQNIATSGNLLVGYGAATYTGASPNPAQQFNTAGSNHAAIYFPKSSTGTTNPTQFNTAIAANIDGQGRSRMGFWLKGSRVFNLHDNRVVADVAFYGESNVVVGENSATGQSTQGVLYARAGGTNRAHVGLQVTNKIRNTGNVEIGYGDSGHPSIYCDNATTIISSPKGGNQGGHLYLSRSRQGPSQGDFYMVGVAKIQGQESKGITILRGPFNNAFELKRADNGLGQWGTRNVAVFNNDVIGGMTGFYFPNAGQVQGGAVNVEAYNVAGSGHYNLRVSGSSRRIKTDISTFTVDTDKVLQLRPVIYKELDKEVLRNTSAKITSVRRFENPNAEPKLGLIAEEVYELIPELTSVGILEDDLPLPEEERVKQPVDVRYQLISLAVLELSKKQQIEINELKDKIAALEDELHNKLDEKFEEYDQLIASLSKLLNAESQKNVELKSQLLELTQRITNLENN